jgi:hypothetical protein
MATVASLNAEAGSAPSGVHECPGGRRESPRLIRSWGYGVIARGLETRVFSPAVLTTPCRTTVKSGERISAARKLISSMSNIEF